MVSLDRKDFMIKKYLKDAYSNNSQSIGWETTISSPKSHT